MSVTRKGVTDALFDGYRLRPAAEFTHEYRNSREGEKTREKLGLRKPNPPTPQAPTPPAIEDADARRQDEGDRLRRRRGRAAAVLTDGNAGTPMTASKTLLGA